MRPILLPACSVNQKLPSDACVPTMGWLAGVGTVNSVITVDALRFPTDSATTPQSSRHSNQQTDVSRMVDSFRRPRTVTARIPSPLAIVPPTNFSLTGDMLACTTRTTDQP